MRENPGFSFSLPMPVIKDKKKKNYNNSIHTGLLVDLTLKDCQIKILKEWQIKIFPKGVPMVVQRKQIWPGTIRL